MDLNWPEALVAIVSILATVVITVVVIIVGKK